MLTATPKPHVHRLTLTDKARDAIARDLASIPVEGGLNPAIHPVLAASILRGHMSPGAIDVLGAYGTPHGSDLLLIENGPIENEVRNPIGPMPRDGRRPGWRSGFASELFLLGMMRLADHQTMAFREEYRGDVVQHLAPEPGRNVPGATSRVELAAHCDNVVLPRAVRPELLGLLGYVNPARVPTCAATVDAILDQLDHWVGHALRQPYYAARSPRSFHDGDETQQVWSSPQPVIHDGPDGRTEIQVSLYNVDVVDPDNREEGFAALRALRQCLHGPLGVLHPLVVGPGALLLISNIRCVHSRAEFDGPRWLIRAYGIRSLAALEAVSGATVPDQPQCYYAQRLIGPQ